jgi:hypothetical protein
MYILHDCTSKITRSLPENYAIPVDQWNVSINQTRLCAQASIFSQTAMVADCLNLFITMLLGFFCDFLWEGYWTLEEKII